MCVDKKTKRQSCRFCHPDLRPPDAKSKTGIHWVCIHDIDSGEPPEITDQICDTCPHFDSKYIEYPITVSKIENSNGYDLYAKRFGQACEVRPSDSDKTYLGILLGELPITISTSHDPKTGVLTNTMVRNPALFVPALNKIVYGCESWWRELKEDEIPSGISDTDIEETPYVKIWRYMHSQNEPDIASEN